MMAPLPVWCQEPVARLDIVREELKDLKHGGQAVGAQVITELSGLRAADDHGPGGAPELAAALLQPRRDERAGPAVPALPARPAHARPVPDGPAREEPGARHRAPVLRRRASTSGSSATTTCSGTSTTSPTRSASRSPSSPPRPACGSARRRDPVRGAGARVSERVIASAKRLGLQVQVQRLDGVHAHGRGSGCRGRLPGGRDREGDRLRLRRRPGRLRRLGQAPHRHRQGGRRARLRRGAPGDRRPRSAPPPASRSAASRPAGTTCPCCSTRRCSSTSACGPPPATPHSLFEVDPKALAERVDARIVDVGE